MTKERFQELVQLYKKNLISEKEFEEFEGALRSHMHDDVLEEDIRMIFDAFNSHEKWTVDTESRIWKNVQASGMEEPKREHELKPVYGRSWFRWSAAAAVIFLLLGSIFLMLPGRRHVSPAPAALQAESISPGRNKAVLTLAGGRQIVLDDARKGDIASQSGTSIAKVDSGLLKYYQDDKNRHEEAGVVYNTVTTPRGGQYQLILPDGTHVWLNAASSITFPTMFMGKDRKVELIGEGYFEVRHVTKQPFKVVAGRQVVEDIGTSFNINCYLDEGAVKTTLIEGAAKVFAGGLPGGGALLRPGQQASLEPDKGLSVADKVDVGQVVAWKNGQLSLTNTDFGSLMRQLSRWYDVDVRYAGKVPEKRFFAVLNRNVNLSTVLEFMQKNGINIRQDGKVLTVLPL